MKVFIPFTKTTLNRLDYGMSTVGTATFNWLYFDYIGNSSVSNQFVCYLLNFGSVQQNVDFESYESEGVERTLVIFDYR